jgi:hypothetical protein
MSQMTEEDFELIDDVMQEGEQSSCRHEWSPWRPGMTMSFAEIDGDFSDEAFAAEARVLHDSGIKGLPGFGISEEQDQSFEHRACMECGEFELRPAADAA